MLYMILGGCLAVFSLYLFKVLVGEFSAERKLLAMCGCILLPLASGILLLFSMSRFASEGIVPFLCFLAIYYLVLISISIYLVVKGIKTEQYAAVTIGVAGLLGTLVLVLSIYYTLPSFFHKVGG